MSSRRIVDPIDPGEQAKMIVAAFAQYLTAAPGRAVILSHNGKRFQVSLEDARRMQGSTLADACAQAGTVITLDSAGAL